MFSFSNLVAVGAIQGMILSAYLMYVAGPGRFFAIFLMLISVNMCVNFYVDGGLFNPSMLSLTIWESLNTYLLLGPLLWLFVSGVTNSESRFKKRHIIHFIPFISYLMFNAVTSPLDLYSFVDIKTAKLLQAASLSFDKRFSIVPLATAFHFCIYLAYCSWVTFQFWLQQRNQSMKNQLYWLLSSLIISFLMMLSICLVSVTAVILKLEKSPQLLAYSNMTTVIGIFAITLLLIKLGRPKRFLSTLSTAKNNQETEKAKPNSNEPSTDIQDLLTKMDHEISVNKHYLQPDFNQLKLASKLEITRHQLSELLSFHPSGGFYELINQLRVKAVIEEMKRRPTSDNLINIAFDCGFNSKSSFNNVFKKLTDKTPSDYRRILKNANQ